MQPMSIEGAWTFTPRIHADRRGSFHEWFRVPDLVAATGRALPLAQANLSVSARGTLRGIHFADVPPGQAKCLTCTRGAMLDVIVDIRVGSPTYGRWDSVVLDETTRRTVYVSEGLGHAFLALTDDATLVYLCSEGYAPEREHTVHVLDPAIGIDWPLDVEPVLSPRDASAPTLAEARAAGLLPDHRACLDFRGVRPAAVPPRPARAATDGSG
jgi:dTDP-4-dehydrorhamnose 3,5-epimerase